MLRRKLFGLGVVCAMLMPTLAFGQTATGGVYSAPQDVLDKIKDEGMNRSQVMQTLGYLSDVIGPRLTASPGMKRGNDWTRDSSPNGECRTRTSRRGDLSDAAGPSSVSTRWWTAPLPSR